MLDLASPTLGVQVDDLMDMGLWRFLQPHLLQTQQGARYYLKNASQRQLLRVRACVRALPLYVTHGPPLACKSHRPHAPTSHLRALPPRVRPSPLRKAA